MVYLIVFLIVVFWQNKLSIFSYILHQIIYSVVCIKNISVPIYDLTLSRMYLNSIISNSSITIGTRSNIQ